MGAFALLKHLQRSQELCSIGLPQLRAFAAATAQLTAIRTLRERTSAPISDVKSALVETAWDEGAAAIASSVRSSCVHAGIVERLPQYCFPALVCTI